MTRLLPQRSQKVLGSLNIRSVQALNEMLHDWLQELASAIRLPSTGHQRRHVDCGSQLPCPCVLTSAQLQCLHEVGGSFVAVALRLEKEASLHPQQLREVQLVAVLFDEAKRLVDQRSCFIDLTDCGQSPDQREVCLLYTSPSPRD